MGLLILIGLVFILTLVHPILGGAALLFLAVLIMMATA